MKTTANHFFAATLIAMTLTACSNNEPQPVYTDDCPSFSATIGNAVSRAADKSWDKGDKIGITGAGRTNVCYITDAGDGIFGVSTSGEQIYFQDENEVTFTAYYPWTDLAGDAESISADTKLQTVAVQKTFDFLWAQASGKKSAPKVGLPFVHKMAKVSFTVRPGDGMSFDEVKAATLSLGGFCHTGSFNVTSGLAAASGDAVDKWVFTGDVADPVIDETNKTVTYSFLFFPQTFTDLLTFAAELNLPDDREYNLSASIDFTSANRGNDTDPKNEWVAGRQYNLSLTLHKTDIKVDGCEIDDWSEVKGDDIDVD